MNGSTRSPLGRVLFASKGEAAPVETMPIAARHGPVSTSTDMAPPRSVESTPVSGPSRHLQRESSPLAFLINRTSSAAALDRTMHATTPQTGRDRPRHPIEVAEARSFKATHHRHRRSLTVRLDMDEYLRFRECASRRDATFQSVLETLVLGYLAPRDPSPNAAIRASLRLTIKN